MASEFPLDEYLASIRKIYRTGLGTAETSFYPALSLLFNSMGRQATSRPLVTVSQVSSKNLDTGTAMFPDFGFIDQRSRVAVLPVEVKPAAEYLSNLVLSQQTLKYAHRYGGKVLITNLWQFGLAETDRAGSLVLPKNRIVSLAENAEAFFSGKSFALEPLWDDLMDLLRRGSMRQGALHGPEEVADLLAYHARKMADAIKAAPAKPDILLQDIKRILGEGLQVELNGEHLVPTVVQTLVYGVFAAWLDSDDPERFEWMRSSYAVTVPVFAEILHEALKPRLLRVCDLTAHLEDIQMVLRWTNRSHFAKDFDGDAIQYFYEPFLARFDSTLRKDLGVWYTPREIADYQVARTHHHIVKSLKNPDGLAADNVYVLDPATGTGTYLISCFDFLVDYYIAAGESPLQSARQARDAILSRFIGFEVLPAAFIICHLHLSRQMRNAGADPQESRLRIYLTNSLTGWEEDAAPDVDSLFPELTAELRSAAEVKHTTPIVAIIGNPPWEGYSTAETVEEKKMMAPISAASSRKWGLKKHRLNDLYVRFWMVATRRIVDITGRGVVSFISNRAWIGGRSYPALREKIVTSYNEVWVDDLHGGYHDQSSAGDQSIFTTRISAGVKVGTAIVTAVRCDGEKQESAVVRVASYRGKADAKRATLSGRRKSGFESHYEEILASDATRFRFVRPEGSDAASIDDYLDYFVSGVQTVRDELVVDFDKAALEGRMRDYFNPALTLDDVSAIHPGAVVKRARYDAAKVRSKLVDSSEPSRFDRRRLVPFLYRPFDRRFVYWETEAKLLNEPRTALRPYAAVPQQVYLAIPQTTRRVGAARPVPSRAVPSYNSVDPDARVFPLYRPVGETIADTGTEFGSLFDQAPGLGSTMVSLEWERAAATRLELENAVTAGETVFYALVAVTHSSEWLEAQPVESDDFAMVPVPGDPELLRRAADVGRRIVDLYDLDTEIDGVTKSSSAIPLREDLRGLADYDDVGSAVVPVDGKPGYSGGKRGQGGEVYWSGQLGWRNIPDEVWLFSAGSYNVLPKWLSYRAVNGIGESGRAEFRSICRRIAVIRSLEPECDEFYAGAVKDPLDPNA